jgi:DNA-directed RNA polymerase specialized sigma24 family protein
MTTRLPETVSYADLIRVTAYQIHVRGWQRGDIPDIAHDAMERMLRYNRQFFDKPNEFLAIFRHQVKQAMGVRLRGLRCSKRQVNDEMAQAINWRAPSPEEHFSGKEQVRALSAQLKAQRKEKYRLARYKAVHG